MGEKGALVHLFPIFFPAELSVEFYKGDVNNKGQDGGYGQYPHMFAHNVDMQTYSSGNGSQRDYHTDEKAAGRQENVVPYHR